MFLPRLLWVAQRPGTVQAAGVLVQQVEVLVKTAFVSSYTDKKSNQIFLIYKEIQSEAVAKSYMTNGLLIYGEIFVHFLIY